MQSMVSVRMAGQMLRSKVSHGLNNVTVVCFLENVKHAFIVEASQPAMRASVVLSNLNFSSPKDRSRN